MTQPGCARKGFGWLSILPLTVILGMLPLAHPAAQEEVDLAAINDPPLETAAALAPAAGAAAQPDPQREDKREAARQICRLIETEAGTRRLPAAFFARLIWKESRFNPDAVSPKGAQGIAQFMPGTAAERNLADPFDIPTALAESALFLRELADTFGNLGLAAAAYNAGPARVERWIAGRSTLPWETLDFVQSITGLPADDWKVPEVVTPDFTLDEAVPFPDACIQLAMAGRPRMPGAGTPGPPPTRWRPWGVQVSAHFSRNVALAAFSRVKRQHASLVGGDEPIVVQERAPARGRASLFTVRIGADSQDEAQKICAKLRAAGGACLVKKN